jgi:hypothetical protein
MPGRGPISIILTVPCRLSDKVGVTQCNNRSVRWDDFVAYTGNLGAVVGYDDYYHFRMQMDGRCGKGGADPKFKFTGKERAVECQYDHFGAMGERPGLNTCLRQCVRI